MQLSLVVLLALSAGAWGSDLTSAERRSDLGGLLSALRSESDGTRLRFGKRAPSALLEDLASEASAAGRLRFGKRGGAIEVARRAKALRGLLADMQSQASGAGRLRFGKRADFSSLLSNDAPRLRLHSPHYPCLPPALRLNLQIRQTCPEDNLCPGQLKSWDVRHALSHFSPSNPLTHPRILIAVMLAPLSIRSLQLISP